MPSTPSILVVEDDTSIRRGLVDALEFEGYRVWEAGEAPEGLEKAIQLECHLVLLDLVLPHGSGLEILEEIRRTRPTLPVIILTARGEENDRVQGLKLGADDYVVKPFSIKELLARVEAVLRRSPERPTDVRDIAIPGGKVDLDRQEVTFTSGGRDPLSESELDLVRYLVLHRGRAVSRDEILSRVWRMDPTQVTTRTIDMHIARLRKKLRDNSSPPEIIITVRGKGYMWGKGGTP